MRRVVAALVLLSLAFAPAPFPKTERHGPPPAVRCHDIDLELYEFQPAKLPGAVVMSWKTGAALSLIPRNITIRSVSLEWSATGTGSWHSIGPRRLESTGRYVWQVPKDVPDSIYMRLAAFDTEGRMNDCQTGQAYSLGKVIRRDP